MASETQYKVYCNDECTYHTAWYPAMPMTCPVSYRHSIDPAKTIKITSRPVDVTLVRIQEENTLTNGNFRYESFTFACPSNCVTSNNIVFPYAINILSTQTTTTSDNTDDILDVIVVPKNPILGITISNISPGESNIFVSNTVLNYMNHGFQCIIGTDNMGEVHAVNIDSNMITTQYASSNTYTTPTYVKTNIPIVKNLKFKAPTTYNVGGGKIGASYLPAGTTMKALYTNNSSNNKEFTVNIEYLY